MKNPLAFDSFFVGALSVAALASPLPAAAEDPLSGTWRGQSITEFGPDEPIDFDWEIVNDGVMGGLSEGKIEITKEGQMRFWGELSLENNGGFTTFRSGDVSLDLSDDLGLLLKVKGDGRTYEARLATDEKFRGGEVTFMGKFETKKGQWQQVRIPFADFKGSFRGMDLSDRKFDPSKIRRIGLLLGDKQQGPFELEIDSIQTYGKGQAGSDLTSTGKKSKGPANLVETVLSDGRFQTLATALTKAELVEVLSGEGPLTVFAPTDEAFAKVPKKVLENLLKPANRDQLVAVLTYHVVPGAKGLGDALKANEIETVQGDAVGVVFSEGLVRVNEATLLDSDVKCSNGVIHVIDSVLLPPEPEVPTLVTVAREAGSFTTLLAAVEAANLSGILESEGPFTVFAPTDEAFAKLPEGTVETLLKEENREQLITVLAMHVVKGKVSAGDALNAGKADSLQGSELRFAISKGRLRVNEATIDSVDIDGGNGFIHVIDSVILPASDAGESQKSSDSPRPEKSHSAGRGSSRMNASEAIVAAIEKGVPLYNGGNAGACAEIYRECLTQLAENEGIEDHTRRMLSRVIESGEKHDAADSRAWLYRRALDGMMVYLHREAN